MNKVIIMGRLTRDPEAKYGQDGAATYARYTLAVGRKYGQKDENGNMPADFIPCVVFGKSAEFADRYFRKGTKIVVVGRIQTGSYDNKDGVKVYTTDVVVEEQEFAESKAASANAGQNAAQPAGYPAAAPASQPAAPAAQTYAQPQGQPQYTQAPAQAPAQAPTQYAQAPLPPGYQMAAGVPPVQRGPAQAQGQPQYAQMSAFMNVPDIEDDLPFA